MNKRKTALKYVDSHAKFLEIDKKNNLFCKICQKTIDTSRKSVVDQHLNSMKHKKGSEMKQRVDNSIEKYIVRNDKRFLYLLTKFFVSTDIPFKKLRSIEMNELFQYMGRILPSESTVRSYFLSEYFFMQMNDSREYLKLCKVFFIVDESEIRGIKFLNILAGRTSSPDCIKAIACYPLEGKINSQVVVNSVLETLRDFNIAYSDLLLFIGDYASYMQKAAYLLKNFCTNMFYVNCLAHLAHNCAMKIRTFYPNVDKLISSMKALTIKNKTNIEIFSEIGGIPDVVPTRWSSWLKACFFYSKNLPNVRKLFIRVKNEGLLYERASIAVFTENLNKDLMEIKNCYEPIILFLDSLEKFDKSINTNWTLLNKITFKTDPANILNYIKERNKESDIGNIFKFTNVNISPDDYSDILKCPSTSITVERSFSMLKSMLQPNRNFDLKNIPAYFICYFKNY